MITYTPAELELLSRKRKPYDQKPRIYQPSTGESIPIDDDFEAFLILSDSNAKAGLSGWLNLSANTLVSPVTRNAIFLTEILVDEMLEAITRQALAKNLLAPYQLVKDSLDAGRFASVPSVQTMFYTISLSTKGLDNFGEFANYQFAFSTLAGLDQTLSLSDTQFKQTLRSYVEALASYI